MSANEALSQTRCSVDGVCRPSAVHPVAGIAALSIMRHLAHDGFARCCVAQSPHRDSVAGAGRSGAEASLLLLDPFLVTGVHQLAPPCTS